MRVSLNTGNKQNLNVLTADTGSKRINKANFNTTSAYQNNSNVSTLNNTTDTYDFKEELKK